MCYVEFVFCHIGFVLCYVRFVLCYVEFVFCHVGFVLCYVGFVLCYVGFVICYVGFVLCYVRLVLCYVGFVLCYQVSLVLCRVCFVLCRVCFLSCRVKQSVVLKLSILRKLRKYLSADLRILYYNYYIKPHFEYCCSIWGQCNKSDTDSIIKLQKQAARLILDADRYAPSAPLFTQLNWQTSEDITHYRKALMVFKALNNQSPTYLTHLFQPACTNTIH